MDLQQTLCRAIDLLTRLGIPYMVVGSVASTHYGEARATHDIDIVIDPSLQQIESMASQIGPGFYLSEAAARDAFRAKSMFNAIDMDTGFKIDFIVTSGSPFDREQFSRKLTKTFAGREIAIISPEDSILSKLIWSKITPSERQLRDVAGIIAAQADGLDRNYLMQWAERLGVGDVLKTLLTEPIA